MRDIFENLFKNYLNVKQEPLTNNKFAEYFCKEVPQIIQEEFALDKNKYKIMASVGKGNWAMVPWIAILNRNITKTPQEGVYIVYLLSNDANSIYLTLNQGCTDIDSKHTIKETFRIMHNRAKEIRNLVPTGTFNFDDNINLGNNLTKRARYYQEGTILYKEYKRNSIPQSKELIEDLKEIVEIYSSYEKLVNSQKEQWVPTLAEYDPGFDKEKWLEILRNKEIQVEKYISVLQALYQNGGQGSCSELALKYGGNREKYNRTGTALAERIIKVYKLSQPVMEGRDKAWPVLFTGRTAAADEEGSFIWKLRPELYDALSEFTFDEPEEGGEVEMTNKEIIEQAKQYIAAKGFSYNDGLIENFYLSLKSKPFVILAGTSGTGKTRLVRLFAEAVGATPANGRYKLVSVRPDWSDSSDLFGHVDLNGNFIAGAITEFVEKATSDKENPYFLCLDEMNLARVEYYLSDILSIMETRDYRDGEIVTDDIPLEKHGALTLPENLYIIGTVNMDETTFPFSKKVLDRANTIEFSYVDLLPEFNKVPEPVDVVDVNNSFLKTEYLYLMNCNDDEKSKAEDICITLQEINEILKTANAHVGYRVRDEIVFYMLNNSNTDLLSEQEALDNEILQKILPRIQGSSSAIRDMICELFKYCAGDYDGYRTDSGEISKKMLKALEEKNAKYPKSAVKLAYMMRRYEEDGFTSYWL